MPGVSLQGM